MQPSQLNAPELAVREIPAGTDNDRATVLTLQEMGRYVRQSVNDPLITKAAALAWSRFGCGLASPIAKAWAVFWWVKHAVTFRTDEDTLLYMARMGEQDLLISPSVLLRLDKRREDCDGFAMLTAAMLQALGVTPYFATVAVDPSDPSRWSHVFVLADVGGGNFLPLDTSHGVSPGWMVPPRRVSRWGAWSMDGKEVSIPMPYVSPLQGFRTRRGVGDDVLGDGYDPATMDGGSPTTTGINFPMVVTPTTTDSNSSTSVAFPWFTGAAPLPTPGGSSSSPSSSWLSGLLNNSFSLAGKILAPNYSQQLVRDPVTGQLVSSNTIIRGATSGPSVLGSSLAPSLSGGSSSSLLLGIGLLVLVGAVVMGSKGSR